MSSSMSDLVGRARRSEPCGQVDGGPDGFWGSDGDPAEFWRVHPKQWKQSGRLGNCMGWIIQVESRVVPSSCDPGGSPRSP